MSGDTYIGDPGVTVRREGRSDEAEPREVPLPGPEGSAWKVARDPWWLEATVAEGRLRLEVTHCGRHRGRVLLRRGQERLRVAVSSAVTPTPEDARVGTRRAVAGCLLGILPALCLWAAVGLAPPSQIGAGPFAPLIVMGLLLTFLVSGALVGTALGGRRLRRRSLCGAVLALLGAVGMTVLLYTLASAGPGPLQRLTLKRFLEVSFVLGGGLGSAFWGGWVSGGWLAPRSGLVAAGAAALFEPLWFLFTLVLLGSGVSLDAPRASLLPTAMLAGATVAALWAAPVGRWLAPCHPTGRAGRPQG